MKIQAIRTLTLLVVLAVITTGSGCSLAKSKGVAEAAVKQFHDKYNSGQYHDIYNLADQEFKNAAQEADFIALLEAIKRKMGTVKTSTQSGWNVQVTTMGTIATGIYDVEFSEGKGSEKFVFLVSGENAKLLRYDVNSPLLIMK